MASWYMRLIPDFAIITQPLNVPLRKKAKLEWTDGHQQVFEAVKAKLATVPILPVPLSLIPKKTVRRWIHFHIDSSAC